MSALFTNSTLVRWNKTTTLTNFVTKLAQSIRQSWIATIRRTFDFILKNALFIRMIGFVISQLKQLWSLITRTCSMWSRERLSRHSERCCRLLYIYSRPSCAIPYPGLAGNVRID